MASFLSQKFNAASFAAHGELLAQAHYKSLGFEIVAVNVFNSRGKRIGEIDFIAVTENSIHFVEVKTRKTGTDRFGGGRQALDYFKQRKLRKLAQLFLLRNLAYQSLRPQIDLCLVEGTGLDKVDFSVTILPHAVSDFY